MATQTPRPNPTRTLAEAFANIDVGRAQTSRAALDAVRAAGAALEGDELAAFRNDVTAALGGGDGASGGDT